MLRAVQFSQFPVFIGCEIALDQLYQVYAESRESEPLEISEGFRELEEFLCNLPLDDNNAVLASAAAYAVLMNIRLF